VQPRINNNNHNKQPFLYKNTLATYANNTNYSNPFLYTQFTITTQPELTITTIATLLIYSKTVNNEYTERIHQMSYSSLSDNGILQIFSFLIKLLYGTL